MQEKRHFGTWGCLDTSSTRVCVCQVQCHDILTHNPRCFRLLTARVSGEMVFFWFFSVLFFHTRSSECTPVQAIKSERVWDVAASHLDTAIQTSRRYKYKGNREPDIQNPEVFIDFAPRPLHRRSSRRSGLRYHTLARSRAASSPEWHRANHGEQKGFHAWSSKWRNH